MKKGLRLLFGIMTCALFFTSKGYSQINYSQDFEVDEGGWSDDDFFAFYFWPCEGDQALAGNMYNYVDEGESYTPVTISPSLGTSNGFLATLTFSYSLLDYDTELGISNSLDWGNITIEYSSSASGPWTNVYTITPANHEESDGCGTKTATFTPPAGTQVYFRITGNHSESDTADVIINIDDITVVQQLGACSGTPAASSTIADETQICNGRTVNFSLSTDYNLAGINFQWQSSTDNVNYTNVPTGGTSATYSATPSVSTWYRASIACGSGTAVTSAPVHVVNNGLNCLCEVDFTSTVEPISRVSFAGIDNESDAEVGGSPAYEDFTSITPGEVTAGETYTITLEGNTNDSGENAYENYFTVFIDWNRDGDFDDASESYEIEDALVLSDGIDGVSVSGDIAVPESAQEGPVYMRIVKNWYDIDDEWDLEYGGSCADENSDYGQAEDYILNVSTAAPVHTIGWLNLQHPATLALTTGNTGIVYSRVYSAGVTEAPGAGAGVNVWVGISPVGSNTNPNTWTTWIPATFNVQDANNDEFMATIGAGLAPGTYYYASRAQVDGGAYSYGGYNTTGGGFWDGTANVSGVLTVTCGTAAPTAAAAQTFCGGSTVANLQATGTVITWYSSATGGTALASTTALTNGGTYYASITPAGGCESATRTLVTVTISSVDTPSVTVVQPTCNTPTGTITVTSPAGAGFTYDANGTGFQNSNTFANLVPGTYTITAKNASNCTASVEVIITNVPAAPDAPSGDDTQDIAAATADDATIEDIQVTATGTVTWYATQGLENALPAGTVLTDGSTYYATQTIDGCESEGFAVTVDVTLGNGEFSAASFKYYPNPVNDILTLSYDKNISTIEVYNIVGQKVMVKTIGQNEAQIDMSQLSAGTYMVKVMSDTASKTIKIVKQ